MIHVTLQSYCSVLLYTYIYDNYQYKIHLVYTTIPYYKMYVYYLLLTF